MKKLTLLLICAAVFLSTAPGEAMTDTTLYKLKRYELNKIEHAASNPGTFNGIQNVVLDGMGEEFNSLIAQVSFETALIPKKIIESFNSAGFELVVTDDISKYSKRKTQDLGDGFYISGFTHIGPTVKQVVILPYKGDFPNSSLYHELGHAVRYIYDVDYKTMFKAFKYDSDGVEELTGKYSNTTPQECWAEAFEYLIMNQNNPEKMAEAAEKMPVSYQLYNKIINQ